ncbi:hypothetical protein D929_01906 [Enterococcus faecalis 02-MB-P-10]|uniref:YehR family lipoprotein n=1 Tax=Enterococcus faecalis TaxID=1351 RepID=UPI00035304DD|nr:DUF1307 domain-containing protein [Enterococcus faecalis]EPH72686.1 hypothetical protein D929_01906 [Enterococcus faecalis 02-MB-P-10]
MKKMLRVYLIFIGVLFLASCGAKTETMTFVGSPQAGIDSTITYTYKGDKVLTQTARNVISYDSLGMSREEARETLDPLSSQYKDVKGINYNMTYEDKQAVEKLTIDYEDLDYDKAAKVDGIQIEGNSSKGISMKKSQELVESQGYTKQK